MKTNCDVGYPFEYRELGQEETEELKNYFVPIFTKAVRLGTKTYFYYKEFVSTQVDFYNMELRPTDTFVMSFPRSGTTWTQELVWLLQNDCNFEKAKATFLPIRFPFIESGAFVKLDTPELLAPSDFEKFLTENIVIDVKSLATLPSPRFLKSHSPLSLLPPSFLETVKVVYVARDPRDVAVSNFFHIKSTTLIPIVEDFNIRTYWNYFIENKVQWSPYLEHVKEAWNQRHHPNMFFILYEELQKDLPAVARRLAKFFGKEYSERQFQELCDHLQFDNFKKNRSVNLEQWLGTGVFQGDFIRKGKSGGWREHFDDEMTRQAERWIADNLRDTDLRFTEV